MSGDPRQSASARPFQLVDRRGDPRMLVEELPDPAGQRLAYFVYPTSPAVVLGSTQPITDLDEERCAALGYRICRRRSGGGAVLVSPNAQVWLDVFVPADDPLFERDIGRATWWLGLLWREALAKLCGDGGDLGVHYGGLIEGPYSRSVCFLGIGPGEVTCSGKKLVGISQRRDRTGAWFFSMAMTAFEPDAFAQVLAAPRPGARDDLVLDLSKSVTGLCRPPAVMTESLARGLLATR